MLVATLIGVAVGALLCWRLQQAQQTAQAGELLRLQGLLAGLEKNLGEAAVERVRLEEKLLAGRDQLEAERRLLASAEQQFSARFENLAQKIFEEKSQKFTEQNKTGLDSLLNPLREQLKDFREKVDNAYGVEARERFALKEQLTRLEGLNKQISDDAINLTRALKGDRKLQGNWGEMILERVLEESGLRKGHEYETQFSTRNDDGQRLIPDVIVRLPENRDIVIDAKVSLVAYERYCSNDDASEKEVALKAHVQSLRNHIRLLSDKGYENLAELRTLDFVFIFMPIEAAFMLAVEADAALFREAFDRRIIIVSPTTLLATLRTVESIWRHERQNQNAEEIARQAGDLHDKFVGFIDTLKRVGEHIERSQQAYETAFKQLGEGKGNLVSRTVRLQKLGAKTKKQMPAEFIDTDARPVPVDGATLGLLEPDISEE
jgi:DNA recombination protein RmuC